MTKDEALKLALEALEKLWNIIDDIDTYGDMAKADEKLYRSLVERRQRTRFEETGITTDGYELSGGAITAIKEALAQPEQERFLVATIGNWGRVEWADGVFPSLGDKMYSAPRTWVGLTDEEIQSEWVLTPQNDKAEGIWFGRRIEAKLKEKNT
jgi:hypothetical protein